MTVVKWKSNSSEVAYVLQWGFADKALEDEFIKIQSMH